MRNFRELQIWQESMGLAETVYRLLNEFPRQEEYGMKSQIKRAAASIPSNIAEGCSRASQREFKYYLEISLGSSFEVETNFLLAEKLGMISKEELSQLLPKLHALQKQINSFITKVKSFIREKSANRPLPPPKT